MSVWFLSLLPAVNPPIFLALALVISLIAFGYYHQVLNSSSHSNSSRSPFDQVPMDAFPPRSNPPYLGYNEGSNQPLYPPPVGPPPDHEYDDSLVPLYEGKPPGYVYDGEDDGMHDIKDPFDHDGRGE